MESQVLEVNCLIEDSTQLEKSELENLSDLQLALAGGGCAEVCPY